MRFAGVLGCLVDRSLEEDRPPSTRRIKRPPSVTGQKATRRRQIIDSSYQLNHTRNANDATRFVKKAAVPSIRKPMANHARLRDLADRWIDLATDLFHLKLRLRAPGASPAKRA